VVAVNNGRMEVLESDAASESSSLECCKGGKWVSAVTVEWTGAER
jgi:hypothetical protein